MADSSIGEADLRKLDDLFAHSPLALVALDADFRISYWSRRAQELLGYEHDFMIGRHPAQMPWIDPNDLPQILEFQQRIGAEPLAALTNTSRVARKDGAKRVFRWTGVAVQENPVYRVIVLGEDVTEALQAQDALAESEERFRALFEHNPDAVLALDLDGTMTACNDAASRISGIPRERIVGTSYTTFLPRQVRPRVQAAFSRAVSGSPGSVALEIVNAQGHRVEVEGTIIPQYRHGRVAGIFAIFQDITQRRAAERQLRTLAYYDRLTGLPNRTYLGEKLRDAIEIAQSRLDRVGLLLIDLDRFKDVNDTLGHARGDRLLGAVAQRLVETIGADGNVARMGGDEFMILLPSCTGAQAARDFAERVIAALDQPFVIDEYQHHMSGSIGIAIYPDDGRDDQALLKNADIAMSRAKERGPHGYAFYDPSLEAPIHMRLTQEKHLRRALELREFVVHYQPQLDLRSDRVTSAEALIRWNHPKSGLILPEQFIPSAEISGLIVQLGDWVLATAAAQMSAWQSELGRMRLAVNLSARQFHQRDLRRRILGALEASGLPPERLEVEITESVAMAEAGQTAEILRELTSRGIRVALDDFGTGYSSLSYLRSFKLDVLKIDGSFVAGIGRSSSDETIVNTVIGMAHNLDMEVIAEGVETREQLAFLMAAGCDAVQGFAIAPAMPGEEFARFIAARRKPAAATGGGTVVNASTYR